LGDQPGVRPEAAGQRGTKEVRILRLIGTIAVASLASAAEAHPANEAVSGSIHVFAHPEHVVTFILAGVAFGVLMAMRRPVHVIAGHALLTMVLFIGAWIHAREGGVLLGVEVAVSGTILAMLGWSVTNVLGAQLTSKRETWQ
ncbi:MAG: hypothetical protein AAF533_08920, partial [Acidobacteriota bacterium]